MMITHKNPNILIVGDFNCLRKQIKFDQMRYISRDENTWRKNAISSFSTAIDHVICSDGIKASSEYYETESDHLASLITITGVDRHKGIAFPVMAPGRARSMTEESKPTMWTKYPNWTCLKYYGPNSIRKTIELQDKMRELKDDLRRNPTKICLRTKEEWMMMLRLANLKNYSNLQPLLDSENRPICRRKDYIDTTIKALDKATGQEHFRCKPREVLI